VAFIYASGETHRNKFSGDQHVDCGIAPLVIFEKISARHLYFAAGFSSD